MKLYELSAEYAQICELAESGEDVTEALAQVQDAVTEKAKRIAYVLKNLSASEDAFEKEIERLKKRRESIARQRDRLRSYLQRCMEAAGLQTLKAPTLTISLSETAPRVEIDDERALPAQYMRTKTEPDKSAILRAFNQLGECVPGARVVRGLSVRIR